MDTISRLSSIYIRIAPNSIRYTLTTIYYPSCQQISVCYNIRVQCYSQRIYIQQSNWFIFDHFGHYFQIIFNLYSYCTKFNSIHINYNILSILSTNFSCYNLRVQCYSQRIYIQQSNWFIFDHFGHYFQIIFNLYSYCTKFNSIHINYNILSILSTNFSCYISRVQSYSQRIYIQQSNWFIFDHFGYYFQIIFNLYSYCTKFNSIHINYNILSILLTNFSLLYLRVQSYSQRIYIQQSNWFIFNHFGHYFQIILNLYSYCTKFNSIHIT